jgi:hypothetical protein
VNYVLPPKAVTDFMYQYGGRVSRAVERCALVEDSERVLGFEESADAYREMSVEISATRKWVSDILTEMVSSDA